MPVPDTILYRLQYQHHALEHLLAPLNDAAIRAKVVTGKWSIFENIVHLAVYQHTFIKRIREILTGTAPSFDRYTAEADPLFHEGLSKTLKATLDDLTHTRQYLIQFIPGLAMADCNKTGYHPLYGKMTVTDWTEFFLLHEAHHLFTIFRLATSLRKN